MVCWALDDLQEAMQRQTADGRTIVTSVTTGNLGVGLTSERVAFSTGVDLIELDGGHQRDSLVGAPIPSIVITSILLNDHRTDPDTGCLQLLVPLLADLDSSLGPDSVIVLDVLASPTSVATIITVSTRHLLHALGLRSLVGDLLTRGQIDLRALEVHLSLFVSLRFVVVDQILAGTRIALRAHGGLVFLIGQRKQFISPRAVQFVALLGVIGQFLALATVVAGLVAVRAANGSVPRHMG